MLGKDYEGQFCTLASALEVVGERWTLLVLRDAFYGVRRFSDFAVHLDIPRAVLSERLRSLVEHGVLERREDPERAGRHVYELTNAGRALWPALHALLRWGERFRSPRRHFAHAACGTRLDEHGACPACGKLPGPEDVQTRLAPGARSGRDDRVSLALSEPHRLLQPLA
jgi:DNA-binding HxlR family transcriptional regulator